MLSPYWRELLALIPGYDSEATAAKGDYFDEDAAILALDFFSECLQLIEGQDANKPFRLQPWQQAIVAALWGWRREDGNRRYRECFFTAGRKNGKTPFSAGLLLLSAYTDNEPGAQLYAAAASRDQASLVFRHCAGMIEREPELSKRARIYRSFKSIEFPATNSILKALASDAGTLHGLSSQTVIVDELHSHKDDELVNVLVTSTAARTSPLIVYLTTADVDRPSIANSKYLYATRVRDGEIEDSAFLPVIYEMPKDADWTDPESWKYGNPNIGVSIFEDYLARECERAKIEPSYEMTFRRLHCNEWGTSVTTRWLDVSVWDQYAAPEPEDLSERLCFAGLDLASVHDLTALTLVFLPLHEGDPLFIKPYFWIPSAKVHRDKADRVPYDAWVRDGWIRETPGEVVDYDRIRADINELAELYDIREIAADRWNSSQLLGQLQGDGFEVLNFGMGFKGLSGPSKDFERLLLSGLIRHDGSPVLRWMIGNTQLEHDAAGNIKPSKKKSTEKIDGVIATLGALHGALAVHNNEPQIIVL